MNQTTRDDIASNGPWTTRDQQQRVPSTSMLPDSKKAAPAPGVLVMNAGQGEHDTVDRLADSVPSAVRHLDSSACTAAASLHAKTDQLRKAGDAWTQSLRTTVRKRPLACVAAALALGMVVARMAR